MCARVVGALHNLSTDLELVLVIRDEGGIVPLVKILEYVEEFEFVGLICCRTQKGDTARSAAGTIMNISRVLHSSSPLSFVTD